ncbi:GNAT family N-acetyltransferase [bacterium]|nr:GNAT family N-acetyltransferase [bacterium]
MLKLMTQIKETTQIKWNRIGKFKPTITINMELGPYLIKTANTIDELLNIFRLRHEVFHREFREIMRFGLDIDKYDRAFDHLLILHKPTQKVVGTYRLRASEDMGRAYTAQEFVMNDLTDFKGPYLELGRACIQKEHRRGAVMALLFRGIAEYMNLSGAQTLFGCSSVKVSTPQEAALIYQHLRHQGAALSENSVKPTIAFKMAGIDQWIAHYQKSLLASDEERAEELIPSLVKMYLKMGAKIACEPAFDKDFNCIDLLTVLRTTELEESLAKRFQVVKGSVEPCPTIRLSNS